MDGKLSYESKGFNLFIKEFSLFFLGVAKNNFTVEFFTVFIPILVLWEMLPRIGVVPSTLLPPPTVILVTFKDLVLNHDLLGHIFISMVRFLVGLLIAIFTAVPIGVLMGWNMFIRKHALPLFQMLAPIPPPAWVPITIILFGIGLPMQIFLVFLGVYYPVLFDTYQGVKDTNPRYIASARAFGASELTLIKKVYLPNALGFIVMGIKIGIALGLVMLVVSEMVGAYSGIGWLLVESKDFFRIDRMVVCMLTLGFIGWFFIEIMKYIESRLALWKVGR